MWVAMASDTRNARSDTIHVRLLDEAVQVWRPVLTEKLTDRTYRILPQTIPGDENWEFSPGDVVSAEARSDETGEYLVAVRCKQT